MYSSAPLARAASCSCAAFSAATCCACAACCCACTAAHTPVSSLQHPRSAPTRHTHPLDAKHALAVPHPKSLHSLCEGRANTYQACACQTSAFSVHRTKHRLTPCPGTPLAGAQHACDAPSIPCLLWPAKNPDKCGMRGVPVMQNRTPWCWPHRGARRPSAAARCHAAWRSLPCTPQRHVRPCTARVRTDVLTQNASSCMQNPHSASDTA